MASYPTYYSEMHLDNNLKSVQTTSLNDIKTSWEEEVGEEILDELW